MAKRRTLSESRFPETADLPDEFDYLYQEWIGMREFVEVLAAKVVGGNAPSRADMRVFDVARCRRHVRAFQRAHPEVAGPYVALFKDCDELLDLVKQASASMTKRS